MKFIPLAAAALFLLLTSACSVPKFKSNAQPIAHALWDSLLQEHVSPEGKVDYYGFQRDSVRLNKYLAALGSAHPNDKNWSSDERLAYWINAYNAFTIKIMVDNYPVKSIKDIKNGIPFVNTVWDIKFINIEGQNYDLNNIEHGIIRERFKEPRIHFAVNCASVSCPSLRNEAFVADKLEQQLNEQALYFINDKSKNSIGGPDQAGLSKIFSWFSGDFKATHSSVIDFINQYSEVKLSPEAKITYLDYDWNAND